MFKPKNEMIAALLTLSLLAMPAALLADEAKDSGGTSTSDNGTKPDGSSTDQDKPDAIDDQIAQDLADELGITKEEAAQKLKEAEEARLKKEKEDYEKFLKQQGQSGG